MFHQDGYTAAACDISLGKNVYVFSENTGAIIHINDRPNCARYPNILDLTRKVFTLFAPASRGRISSLQVDTLDSIDSHIFSSLGIELDMGAPSVYFVGDGVQFDGRVLDGKPRLLFFLQNTTTKEEISKLFTTDASGRFHAVLTLPSTPGKYSLVLASGNSFKTETFATLTLVDPLSMNYPFLPQNRMKMTPTLDGGKGVPSIPLGSSFWGHITLRQDTKSVQMSGKRIVFDQSLPFHTGIASASIDGYIVGSGGSLDRLIRFPNVFSGSIILDRIHEKTGQKYVSIRNNLVSSSLKFRVPTTPRIRSSFYLTLPDGDVREFDFSKEYIGTDGFLLPGKVITLSLPTDGRGTYLVESVQDNGIAYFNLPIIR